MTPTALLRPRRAGAVGITEEENGTVKKRFMVGGLMALGSVTLLGGWLLAQPGTTTPPRPATAPAASQTRIALLNLTQVIKGYNKYINFQNEMKGLLKVYEDKHTKLRTQVEGYQKDLQKPDIAPATKEQIEKDVRRLQREIEDNNNDAKAALGKRSDDEMLLLYKEVQDAASRFAMARNYDLVLSYNDVPSNSPEFFAPMSVARRMQTQALLPLYSAHGMDISEEVKNALNAAYGPAKPATTGTTTPAPTAPH
jgi:Skp family chaperone for outer membrane proteins